MARRIIEDLRPHTGHNELNLWPIMKMVYQRYNFLRNLMTSSAQAAITAIKLINRDASPRHSSGVTGSGDVETHGSPSTGEEIYRKQW